LKLLLLLVVVASAIVHARALLRWASRCCWLVQICAAACALFSIIMRVAAGRRTAHMPAAVLCAHVVCKTVEVAR